MPVAGLLILLLVALTTAAGYAIGVHALGLRRASVPAALGKSLECIGVALLFMIANTALGFALILALRAAGGTFVSLYVVSDPSVAILSLLQAIAFQTWLDSRERAQSTIARNDDLAKIEDQRPQ